MLPLVLAIVAIVLGVIGAVVILCGREELGRRRVVMETPTTDAARVASGFVEVKGTVEAGETLVSPFLQLPAVLCRWRVEEYRSSGKSGHWSTVLSGDEARDFWIRDQTGRVRVRLEGSPVQPQLYLTPATNLRSGAFKDAPPHVEEFLRQHGRSAQGWVFNKSMRYREEVIQPGEPIYGLGFASRQGSEAALAGTKAGELVLANCTEEELQRRLGRSGFWMTLGGVALIAAGFAIVAALPSLRELASPHRASRSTPQAVRAFR